LGDLSLEHASARLLGNCLALERYGLAIQITLLAIVDAPPIDATDSGATAMSAHAGQEQQRVTGESRRAPHCPDLSVVLLSQGDRMDLERALAAVAARCRRMEAQIIVVRSVAMDDIATLASAYPSVHFLEAPAESTVSAMREMGMGQACGDIVALRLDGAVGDGAWLDAFCAMVGTVDEVHPMEREVALATAIDESPQTGDRRRARVSSYAGAPASTQQKRRGDAGRASAGYAEVGAFAQTLRPEM